MLKDFNGIVQLISLLHLRYRSINSIENSQIWQKTLSLPIVANVFLKLEPTFEFLHRDQICKHILDRDLTLSKVDVL